MRMQVVTVMAALIAIIVFVPASRSASFDCTKALHPLEKIICQTPSLSSLDSEVGALYRSKLAQLFDKLAFKAQQRNWQQVLRGKCASGCKAADVEADYRVQRDTLQQIDEDNYEASYKTADVASLRISHLPNNQFDFSIRRELDDKLLCAIPASDSEAGTIATLVTPTRASWTQGTCKIDFLLTRDATGHVPRIDVAASAGCQHYCRAPGRYALSDVYMPANDWVASNQ